MAPAIKISSISLRPDARDLIQENVAALAESIASVGLLNPVIVRAAPGGFELIAGRHRLEAFKRLGLADIPAEIVTKDDLPAELAAIDENLCRAELSPSERAAATARRKAIYEEMHPETAHGAIGVGREKSRQVGDSNPADRFTANTAAATGRSERAVQRDAERGEKVLPEVMEMIRGTALDTGAYLDKIKRYPPNDQVAAAKRDLAEMRRGDQARRKPKAADPARIPAPMSAADQAAEHLSALMTAWNKAGEKARSEFLDRIGAALIPGGDDAD